MGSLQQRYCARYDEAAGLFLHGSVQEGLDLCLDLRRRNNISLYLRAMVNASLALYSDTTSSRLEFANECLEVASILQNQAAAGETKWLVDQAQELVERVTDEVELEAEKREIPLQTTEEESPDTEVDEPECLDLLEDLETYYFKSPTADDSLNISWEEQFAKHWNAAKERAEIRTRALSADTRSMTDTMATASRFDIATAAAASGTMSLPTYDHTAQDRKVIGVSKPTSSTVTSFSEIGERKSGEQEEYETQR